MKFNKPKTNEQGAILLMMCVILLFISVLSGVLAQLIINNIESGMHIRSANKAFYLSESGARYALSKIADENMGQINKIKGTYTLKNGDGFTLYVNKKGRTIDLISFGFSGTSNVTNKYEIPYVNGKPMASDRARERANENSAIHGWTEWTLSRIRDYWVE